MARQRRPDQPGADRLHRPAGRRLRLLPVLQLSLLPRLARRAPRAAQGDPGADRGARRRARPVDLRAGVPRRAGADVQLAGRARHHPGRLRQHVGAGRRRRHRLRPAARDRARALPPQVRRLGPVRDLRRAHRREQGLRRAVRLLRQLPAAPRPAALADPRRHVDPADSGASAHPASRLHLRPRQVRRHRRLGGADHAVALREPVDGGARGVGPGPAGAGQRPLRRAARPDHPQPRRALLRRLRRVRRGAVHADVEPAAAPGVRRERPPLLRAPLRVAGDPAQVRGHARRSCRGPTPRRPRSTRCPAGWRAGGGRWRRRRRSSTASPRARWPTTSRRRPRTRTSRGHRPAARPVRRRVRRRSPAGRPSAAGRTAAAGGPRAIVRIAGSPAGRAAPASRARRPAAAPAERRANGGRHAGADRARTAAGRRARGIARTAAGGRTGRVVNGGRRGGTDDRPGARRLDGCRRARGGRASRPSGAGDARLRRRHRPRGARHPEGAARRRLPLGHLRRDRRLAARGPDPRLSRPDRRGDARDRPHPPLLDRIARLARRLRAAGADDPRLPQHHAAGVLRRRASAAGGAVLPRSPRARRLRLALRAGARRLRVQPAGTGRARLPADRRPAGRPELRSPRRGARSHDGRRPSTTAGPTCCSSAGSSRTRRSRTSSGTSTPTRRGTTRGRGCCWSARRAASSATSRCCRS